MFLNLHNVVRVAAVVAATSVLGAVAAHAAAITAYDTTAIEWDVGSGQVNNHFVTTTDSSFAGGSLQLAMRAEQRSVGGVTPSPLSSSSYLVQTGADPSNSNRAWWNFHLAVNFAGAGGVGTLDALSLYIERQDGTNGNGGTFNLLPFLALLNNDNTPTADSLEIDQNAKFAPWFTPSYDLLNTGSFAYRFILSATNTDGETTSSVSTEMCVHTEGVNCVPEPSSYSLTGAMGAVLALFGYAVYTRRRYTM